MRLARIKFPFARTRPPATPEDDPVRQRILELTEQHLEDLHSETIQLLRSELLSRQHRLQHAEGGSDVGRIEDAQ
jgi:hypothetical protein